MVTECKYLCEQAVIDELRRQLDNKEQRISEKGQEFGRLWPQLVHRIVF